MLTTLRAALAVLLLAGFYVVAIALLVALGLGGVWVYQQGNERAGVQLFFAVGVAAVGLVIGIRQVARAKPEPEPGLVLTHDDAPELWSTVAELAAAAQTRPPDEVRLVAEVNAAVSEDVRHLGLVGGTRRLYLGVPLLVGLDVSQLRSVLGHELGHYSSSHTRLGPITYRGQLAIDATLDVLRKNAIGYVLRLYRWLYVLVSVGVTRRQELEADRVSVRVAGRETAQSALLELPVLDAAWGFYEAAYIAPGWESGLAPTSEGFFAGFRRLLDARRTELDEMRREPPSASGSWWDTHPPIATRVAVMARADDAPVARDTRPASALVPRLDELAARLADEVVAFGDRQRLEWAELSAAAVAETEQRAADSAFRAAARLAGVPRATLGTVLDLLAAGRGPELARELGVPLAAPEGGDAAPAGLAEPALPTLRDVVVTVLGAAATQSGAARWQHSWAGPAQLVGTDGAALELEPVADLALRPGAADGARERLRALGVDVASAGQVAERATAHGGEVVDALANVDVNGQPHDVVLLDRGLVLVPCPKKKDEGKQRLISMLASTSVVELAERHRYVAYEDVARATLRKRSPVAVDLVLHSGEALAVKESWTGETLTKHSSDALYALALDLSTAADEVAPAEGATPA